MIITRTGSINPFRSAMDDVFDSMELEIMAPLGMGSRLPTKAFPRSSTSLVVNPCEGGRESLHMNLDFHETSKGFGLSVDLPGMKKEDIKVDIDNESGVLTVTGERKRQREEERECHQEERKYHFVERSCGRTTRSIRLPDTADTANASAVYVNGVLKLNFPKRKPPSARRFQIPIDDDGGPSSSGNEVP